MPAIIRSGNGESSNKKNDRQLIIKQMPGLITYTEGDPLDLSGLEVQFKDKNQPAVLLAAEKYKTVPANGTKMNRSNNTINISYTTDDGETIFTSFSVAVRYASGISLISLPKTRFDIGEKINTAEAVVNLNYSDGSFKKLENTAVTFNPANETSVTKNLTEVIATYVDPISGKELSDSEAIFVRYVSGLKITTLPKTSYVEGEPIDLKNLKTTLLYNDGLSMELLDNEINVSPAKGSNITRDITKLTITHTRANGEELSAELPLKVKYIVGIVVSKRPNKLNYKVGDKLSLDGVKISVVYNDTSTEVIDDYISTPAPGDTITQDNSNVVFSYLKNGQTYNISQVLNVKYVESITVVTPPKVSYYEGDRLDLSDLTLQANYNDGSSINLLAADYKTIPTNNTILNRTNEALKISYLNGGKEFSASIRLIVTYPTSLTMVNPPKSAYKINDLLDLTAMKLNLNYSDGSFKKVNDFTTDPRGGATLSATDRTLTVTYMDGAKPITLIHPLSIEDASGGTCTPSTDVTGIKISTPPKVSYREGELLDLDGMVVKTIKKDGSSEIIDGYTTTPINGTKLSRSNESITIRYVVGTESFVAIQPISVKYHTGIAIGKRPKISYTEGDALDLSGMKLHLLFNDNSEEIVANYSSTPADGTALTKEITEVVINYMVDGNKYTATQAITVKEKDVVIPPAPQASPVVSIKITTYNYFI